MWSIEQGLKQYVTLPSRTIRTIKRNAYAILKYASLQVADKHIILIIITSYYINKNN